MNEYHKYSIIKNLVDNGGNKNNAAIKLNLSRRHLKKIQLLKKKENINKTDKEIYPSNESFVKS